MTIGTLDRQLEHATRWLLQQHPSLQAVYLFGSYAREQAWPDSDVDIGLLLPRTDGTIDRLGLNSQLAEILGKDVDVVDLRRTSLDLIADVLRHGKKLSEADPDATLDWELAKMALYAEWQPIRRQIAQPYLSGDLRQP